MTKLSQLDQNFAARTEEDGLCYRNVAQLPELFYGLMWSEHEGYYRMPADVASTVNTQVRELAPCTAGGRVRFVTDSKTIALRVQLQHIFGTANMAYIGTAGFDLYDRVGKSLKFCCSFSPEGGECYTDSWSFPDAKIRSLQIHFPLYAGVKKLELGLQPNAVLQPSPYEDTVPVIFYGSSITQGGCASRPGCAYTAILSRELDFDYRNLGFSSGARAENTMIEYLKNQPMRLLVLDYDHNAPNPAYLEKTHYPMYEKLRRALPDIPIVLVSAPVANPNAEWLARRDIVRTTYERAIADGDDRIAFVDGTQMFPAEAAQECMVDIYHPNDLGMHYMAKAFVSTMQKLLNS